MCTIGITITANCILRKAVLQKTTNTAQQFVFNAICPFVVDTIQINQSKGRSGGYIFAVENKKLLRSTGFFGSFVCRKALKKLACKCLKNGDEIFLTMTV